ncbi:Imm10 family immunity protein [Micromonospora cathayae]|uniref:Imm10 family immunity protein n=1 Tax=Micromonospora cathayae TaxID=3028804 RepID=A0ABY7ZNS8_9ACTN|nr:Imm10 family immunity protein [Micromonospora sp. HUAS 3]WDZ84086.1 Imm10 family immunity protein [Micromonospora sp. HUAS 3]
MILAATEIGFFEDYEGEEVLEVGVAGVDDAGVHRSLSVQRSTYEPDDQEVRSGMDSYSVSTERGLTVYGCLRRVELTASRLTLELVDEDADALGVATPIQVALTESGVERVTLSEKLREILEWGAHEKRPELVGLDVERG